MFYYKRGDIEITDPWERPNNINFESFLNDFKKIKGIKDYQVYLVGAFCENYYLNTERETWDVDLILIGEIKDYLKLKNILNRAMKIGFKHSLLVDISWRSSLPNLNLFSQEKVITYTNAEQYTLETEWKQSVEGEIKEILSGLYYVKFNPIKAYNKFISKNYTLSYKKIEF
jgi:hypothetical protein